MNPRDRQWRSNALLVTLTLGFVVVFVALASLQVVRHGHWSSQARQNRQDTARVPAPRGVVADRNGVTLADNRYQATVTISRAQTRPGDPTLTALVELLDLDPDEVRRTIDRSTHDPVVLVKHADPEQIAKVEEHRAVLPHVRLSVGPRRQYPGGSLAAHVLGYVGEVRPEDIDPGAPDPYEPRDIVGRAGVEQFAESLLRGRNGLRVVEVNAAGHIVGEVDEGRVPVLPGVLHYLTLSHPLQSRLEELLEPWVGAGVVLEVGTGDVLAIASSPGFDPNVFTGGISPAAWNALNNDPRKPLFNRTLKGTYPPGSPYKIVTAVAALESGKVTTRSTFEPCTGGIQFGNRFFRCWERSEGHGVLNLHGALVESCDVYFYQVAQLISIDDLADVARRFGFGRPTGLALGGEKPGLVPDSRFYDTRYGPGQWTRGVVLNNSIGQGELLVTPLQMARAYAAIGGDRSLYRPHLILATENVFGVREVRRIEPEAEPVCSPQVQRIVKRALRDVVDHEDGTGELAAVVGLPVAGKTGTAENPHGEHHAWFVAYAPEHDPEVAVAVILENAGHGGEVAAPLVGQLLSTYFSWQAPVGR